MTLDHNFNRRADKINQLHFRWESSQLKIIIIHIYSMKKWQIGLETRYDPYVSHLKEVFKYDMNTAIHTLEKRDLYLIVVKEIPK